MRGLYIGQPDGMLVAANSKVWLLRAPIMPGSLNVLPNGPLLDPASPSSFGACMARGKFRDPGGAPLGQQLIITARDKTYQFPVGQPLPSAGEAYVYVPAPCSGQ
jgi:hypothetical protein